MGGTCCGREECCLAKDRQGGCRRCTVCHKAEEEDVRSLTLSRKSDCRDLRNMMRPGSLKSLSNRAFILIQTVSWGPTS